MGTVRVGVGGQVLNPMKGYGMRPSSGAMATRRMSSIRAARAPGAAGVVKVIPALRYPTPQPPPRSHQTMNTPLELFGKQRKKNESSANELRLDV